MYLNSGREINTKRQNSVKPWHSYAIVLWERLMKSINGIIMRSHFSNWCRVKQSTPAGKVPMQSKYVPNLIYVYYKTTEVLFVPLFWTVQRPIRPDITCTLALLPRLPHYPSHLCLWVRGLFFTTTSIPLASNHYHIYIAEGSQTPWLSVPRQPFETCKQAGPLYTHDLSHGTNGDRCLNQCTDFLSQRH